MELDVFICHATEDKDSLVRPLAHLLRRLGLSVWYDEYTLKLGNSLRRSIDKGLQSCRFGVVVLSPSFFRKEWPQRELDGLVVRETLGAKVILPLLHGVSIEEVARYSPPLADRIAVSSAEGLSVVADKILEVVAPDAEASAPLDLNPGRFLKEIEDQPLAIERTLARYLDAGEVDDTLLGPRASELLGNARQLLIIGAGSSCHAGMIGRYWVETIAGIPCTAIQASEFSASDVWQPTQTLALLLSQSGETRETIEALHATRGVGILGTCVITNERQSMLASQADLVIATRAGHEIAVPATKSFTSALVALLLLIVAIARHRDTDPELLAGVLKRLQALPAQMSDVLRHRNEIEEIARTHRRAESYFVIGQGDMSALARYGAYEIAKCTYTQVGGYYGGEVKHGAIALVDESVVTLALAPNHFTSKIAGHIAEIRARDGRVIVFAPLALKVADASCMFCLPDAAFPLAPILYAIPLQLFAYYAGIMKGHDVGGPRGLLPIRTKKLGSSGIRVVS